MQKPFLELTPDEAITWVRERRTRRDFRKPKPSTKAASRLTIKGLASAWGVSPAKLEEILLTRAKQNGTIPK